VGRFAAQDRADIEILAKRGLLTARAFRARAEAAAVAYVGDLQRVRRSIEMTCRIIEDIAGRKQQAATRKRWRER
jgi:hypothetical protein